MPAIDLEVRGTFFHGRKTEAAGTLINVLVDPRQGLYTRILHWAYTSAATAHTVTFLRVIGATTLAQAAAASQAVLNLAAQPATSYGGPTNNVAANDYLAWENDDGTFAFGLVSSVSGLAITMTANLAKAAGLGKKVWFLGVLADVNTDGNAHPTSAPPASATTIFTDGGVGAGVMSSLRPYEPILVQSSNATAAGSINHVAAAYTAR